MAARRTPDAPDAADTPVPSETETDKVVTEAPAAVLRFIGAGQYITGVPARDLTAADVAELATAWNLTPAAMVQALTMVDSPMNGVAALYEQI